MALEYGEFNEFNLFDDSNLGGFNIGGSGTPDYLSSFSQADFSNDIAIGRASETGSLADFLYGGITGAVSGMTFGLLRFGPEEENQTMAYRMGAGLGNVGSLVAPWGPFGLAGKASRYGISGLSKGGRAISKAASSKVAKDMSSKGLGEKYLKSQLDKQLLKDKATRQYIARHGISDDELIKANDLLQRNLAAGLKSSFKTSGKTVDDRIANEIAEKVAVELRKPGRHINTIEDWVESAIGTRFPRMMGNPAKYLGMAAQDFYLFASHNLISAGVGNMVHDDQIGLTDLGKNVKHSLVLAGIFPGIRAIPGGGKYTLKQGAELFRTKRGLNSFRKEYRKTNYQDMVSTKKGEQSARGLLGMLTRGSDMNVQNVSLFKGMNFKVKNAAGKSVTYTPEKILTTLGDPKKMPASHVSQLLDKYRAVADKSFREWGAGYLREMLNVGQIARMTLGSLVMNSDMFTKGYYKYTPGPELFQHMAIGAMMTKGRGLWGRHEVSQWSRKFTKYQETYNYLNMEHGRLSEMVKAYDQNRQIGELFGVTVRGTRVGSQLYNAAWGEPNKNTQISTDYADGKVDQLKFEKVSEILKLANAMKLTEVADPLKFTPVDPKRLSKERIDELYERFNEIKFADGTSIKEYSLPDILSVTQIDVGMNNANFYYSFLDELARETGLPIVVKKDKTTGEFTGQVDYYPIIMDEMVDFSIGGKYEHSINKVKGLLDMLSAYKIANPKANSQFARKVLVEGEGADRKVVLEGEPGKDIGQILESMVERYMGHVVRNAHGNNNSMRFPFLETTDNPYLTSVLQGRMAQVRERAFRLANGKVTDDPKFQESEQNFLQMTDYFFKVNVDMVDIGPNHADIGKFLKKPPKVVSDKKESKLSDTEKAEQNERIDHLQRGVNEIHDWMKVGGNARIEQEGIKHTITIEEAEVLIESQKGLKLVFPIDEAYSIGFKHDLADYNVRRKLASIGFNEEALAVASAARDNGFFDLESKKILTPSALKKSLERRGDLDGAEIDNLTQKYSKIYDILSKHNAVSDLTDPVVGGDLFLIDPKGIQSVYDVTSKGLAPKIQATIDKTIKRIERSTKDEDITKLGVELNKLFADFNTYMEGISGRNNALGLAPNQVASEASIRTALEDFKVNSVKILQEIHNKVSGSSVIANEIQRVTSEINLLIQNYSEAPLGSVSNRYNPETIMTIGNAMTEIIKNETKSSKRLNENLARLSSLGNSSAYRGEIIAAQDRLLSEISKDLKRPDIIATMSLEDAIMEYVNNKSFESLSTIVNRVVEISARTQSWNEYERDNTEATQMLDNILKAKAAHNKNVTPMKVIKKFKLTSLDEPNKVDPEFVDLVSQAVEFPSPANDRAIEVFVQKRVGVGSPLLAEFKIQYPVLLKQLAGIGEYATVYSINEKSLEFENTVVTRKTLGGSSSSFLKALDLEGVGTLSDVVIIGDKKMTLNQFTKEHIQNLVNKNPLVDIKLQKKIAESTNRQEIEDAIAQSNKGISDVRNKLVLDLHAGSPLVLPLTEYNIKRVHEFFTQWHAVKVEKFLDAQGRRNFEYGTELLLAKSGRESLEAKMLLMNLDAINSGGFDKLFSQSHYRQDSKINYKKLQDKLLKLSKQGVNENYARVANGWLDLIKRTSGIDIDIRNAADKFSREGVSIQVISDEAYGEIKNLPDYPTSNKKVVTKHYDKIIANKDKKYTVDEISAARESKREALIMESLNSSQIDGNISILDHEFTMLNGAITGEKNNNGFKNNIAHNRDILGSQLEGVLVKGYMHENPFITKDGKINIGTTFLMGESTAKTLYGLNVNGNEIVPRRLDSNLNLVENLRLIKSTDTEGKLTIPFESIGFGYGSQPGENVLVSHSMSDFLGRDGIRAMSVYKGLINRVKQLSKLKSNFEQLHNNDQALALFQQAMDETGYDFTDGGYALAEVLLRNGAMSHHNSVIRQSVLGLFKSKVFDQIRRPTTEKGRDSYIVNDYVGDHAPPMFRTVKRNIPVDGISGKAIETQDVFRVVTNFGEISVAHSMGQIPIESFSQVDFVAKLDGRDIAFRYDVGTKKIKIVDHLYDVQEKHNGFVGDNQKVKAISDKNKKLLTLYVQELETMLTAKDTDLSEINISGLHTLMKHGYIMARTKVDTKGPDGQLIPAGTRYMKNVKPEIKKFFEKVNMGLLSTNVAIPKKALDVGVNRIKEVLHQDFGNHTILNAHDLRVMHQRDGDGDHLYGYTNLPRKFVEFSIRRMGVIKDYQQLPRTPHDVNILGLDQKNRIGEISEDVGFTDLKNKVNASKFAIGELIQLKNIVNTAKNMGIKFNHRDGTVSEFENLTDIDGLKNIIGSRPYEVMIQMGLINQNSVDIWGGGTDIAAHMRGALLNGDVPKEIQQKLGINFRGVVTNSAKFRQLSSDTAPSKIDVVERNLNRDIQNMVLNVLKRSSSMFSDPFNDGGQFTPSDFYVKSVHNEMKSFLSNPNEYLVARLFRKYTGNLSMQQAILNTFYKDYKSAEAVQDASRIKEFIGDVMRGKVKSPNHKFITIEQGVREGGRYINATKSLKKGKIPALIETDDSGLLLNEIAKRGILRDKDYYGDMLEANKDVSLADFINRTGNLLNRVTMYRSFFPNVEPSTRMSEELETAEDYFRVGLPVKDKKKGTLNWHNKEMRSVAHHLLGRDAGRLKVEIAKMEGFKGKINEYEKSVVLNKLADIESTLQILDKMAMKELIDPKVKVNIINTTKLKKRSYNAKHIGKAVHIYSIKGEHLDAKAVSELNLNQLEYVGKASNGDYKTFFKGRTYIEVKNPLVRKYIGDKESLEAIALHEAIDMTTNVENIIPNKNRRIEFYDDLYELQKTINADYTMARKALIETPAQKNKAFEFAGDRDQMELETFLETWNPKSRTQLNEEQLMLRDIELIKLIVKPRAVPGEYVEVDNLHLPYLSLNSNLFRTSLQYMKNKGYFTQNHDGTVEMPKELESILEYQREAVKKMQGVRPDNDAFYRLIKNHSIANDISSNAFEKLGESAEIIKYLFDDWDFMPPEIANILKTDSYEGVNYTLKNTGTKGKKSKVIFRRKKKNKRDGCPE